MVYIKNIPSRHMIFAAIPLGYNQIMCSLEDTLIYSTIQEHK